MIRVHAPTITPPKDDSSKTEQKSEYPGLKNKPTKKYSERDEDEAETTSGEADDQSSTEEKIYSIEEHVHEEIRDSLEGGVIKGPCKYDVSALGGRGGPVQHG